MTERVITDKRILKVANRLKKLRISKGYTSYENFALDHDLPRMQYWRMERGANFRIESLLKILEIYNLSLEEFFSKELEKTLDKKNKKTNK
jgi:transcriptional regulator with XRE-family HTH domain